VRRIVLWCLSTLSVLVLLFGYHTSTSSTLATRSPTSIISGTTPGSTSSAATSTVTGSEVPTRWGPVQVQLAVAGTTITRVDVVEYPSGNPKDSEINSYALPILVQETLDQQSADIDMVSGATVTSTGYLQSLQSALDRVTT
jgi:uncharacterized protein with FMN-binding domain